MRRGLNSNLWDLCTTPTPRDCYPLALPFELEFPLCLPSQFHLIHCQAIHLVNEGMGPTKTKWAHLKFKWLEWGHTVRHETLEEQ